MDSKRLLIIGSVWPEPTSSAAGKRMMQVIELFQLDDWHITFASSSAKSGFSEDLSGRNIDCVSIKMNCSSFDDFIDSLKPDAVMFDRFVIEEQYGWRVAKQCPDTMQILDTEDLHCLRRTRKKVLKKGRKFRKKDLLQEDTTKREIASILRCDLSLIISEFELQLLADFFDLNDALLQYLPFWVDLLDKVAKTNWPKFENRSDFMTIGNFRHAPNWDAVLQLKQHIWPLIRQKLPNARLHVYGAYPSKKAQNLHHPNKGFLIEGRAENAAEVVRQARVCLAPLRFGAGLKGKLLEAMQCGTPSVTTGVGAEGLGGEMPWAGAIEDDPQKFADAAAALYLDKSKWKQAQKQGVAIINQRFADKKFGAIFLRKVNEIRSDLYAHRLQNFTGAVLRHHTAASTKYMSRWIEEKNKHKN